jgi:hypothetical protein
MKTIAVHIAVSAALLLCASPALAAAPALDLTGAWTLCQDPDGSPKDSMQFKSDGTGSVTHADARVTEFLYKVDGHSLQLLAHVGDRAVPISMSISDDGQKLMAYSETTKNTSFYVRESETAKFQCTAK